MATLERSHLCLQTEAMLSSPCSGSQEHSPVKGQAAAPAWEVLTKTSFHVLSHQDEISRWDFPAVTQYAAAQNWPPCPRKIIKLLRTGPTHLQ